MTGIRMQVLLAAVSVAACMACSKPRPLGGDSSETPPSSAAPGDSVVAYGRVQNLDILTVGNQDIMRFRLLTAQSDTHYFVMAPRSEMRCRPGTRVETGIIPLPDFDDGSWIAVHTTVANLERAKIGETEISIIEVDCNPQR